MHHIFKRVVVVLNNLKNIDNVLRKAKNFSIEHQTTLEILYVQEEALFEIPDYFLSEDKIANERLDKKRIKSKIQEHLSNLGIHDKHAILVYEDDTINQVLHYAKEQKDILFITSYHETLSETLLEKTPYSFWIIKNDFQTYQHIAIPLDFTEEGKKVLQATQHIFPKTDITILHDYRYLLDSLSVQVDYLNIVPLITPEMIEFNEVLKKEQKKKFENYKKEFNVKGECIKGEGALDQDLKKYISKKDFNLTVMYHQDAELFLSPSLIIELLKEVSTDFLIFNL
jgi:hypothetical protein